MAFDDLVALMKFTFFTKENPYKILNRTQNNDEENKACEYIYNSPNMVHSLFVQYVASINLYRLEAKLSQNETAITTYQKLRSSLEPFLSVQDNLFYDDFKKSLGIETDNQQLFLNLLRKLKGIDSNIDLITDDLNDLFNFKSLSEGFSPV